MLPPLLRLPIELHQDIITRLDFQDTVQLSRTNRYFLSIVTPPRHEDLLAVEATAWAALKALFTCGVCVRLRHMNKFADGMRKGKQDRGGVQASKRYCMDCGAIRGWYQLGTEITIMGRALVLYHTCRPFTDRPGIRATRDLCMPRWKAIQKKCDGGEKVGYEDDCGHLTKSYLFDGRFDGFWFEV